MDTYELKRGNHLVLSNLDLEGTLKICLCGGRVDGARDDDQRWSIQEQGGRETWSLEDEWHHYYPGAVTAGSRYTQQSALSSLTSIPRNLRARWRLVTSLWYVRICLIYGLVSCRSTYHMETQSNRQHPGHLLWIQYLVSRLYFRPTFSEVDQCLKHIT